MTKRTWRGQVQKLMNKVYQNKNNKMQKKTQNKKL